MHFGRHLASVAVLAGFLGLNTATSKPKEESTGPAASSAAPVVTVPATKTPADLDVAAAIKELGCGRRAPARESDGCRVLSDFESASAPPDLPDKGPTIWFGQVFGIGDAGDGKKDFYILRMNSPAGMSDKDTLDAIGSAKRHVPPDEYDAVTLLAQLKAGKNPSISSRTALAILAREIPSTDAPLVKTSGTSYGILYPDARGAFIVPLFAYMRKKGDHIVLVEYRGGTSFGDKTMAKAWISELWLFSPRT